MAGHRTLKWFGTFGYLNSWSQFHAHCCTVICLEDLRPRQIGELSKDVQHLVQFTLTCQEFTFTLTYQEECEVEQLCSLSNDTNTVHDFPPPFWFFVKFITQYNFPDIMSIMQCQYLYPYLFNAQNMSVCFIIHVGVA